MNIILIIDVMVVGVLIFLTSIVWHEMGHMIFFKTIGVKVKLNKGKNCLYVGELYNYTLLNRSQYKLVNLFGIVSGLIPIGIATAFVPLYFVLYLPYLFGCRQDMEELFK